MDIVWPPPYYCFTFCRKIKVTKVVYFSKICYHTKFRGMLSETDFVTAVMLDGH